MKINHNFFSISNKIDVVKYFCRQGNILPHLMDRIRWHVYPRFYVVSKFPTHIDIEVSSACNLRCPMCKSTEMRKTGIKFGKNMEWDLYRKIIDECSKSSLYSIKLSWRGEPLIHPKIVDMVRYAKDKKIKDVAFLTNGSMLDRYMNLELVNAGLDWVGVSFDGFKEDYERIRFPAKFEHTMDNVKDLRKCREYFNLKKPQIRIQSIQSVIEGREKEFLRLWEGIADKVYFIRDEKRTIDEKDYAYHDTSLVCPNPWQRLVVASDGTIPQCITDYTCGGVLGNANTQTISEIWHSTYFNILRRQMKEGDRLKRKPCRICEK